MTGETQLRARRTRIKILRAIAEKRGAARFSDIRNSTGLSTGSIYYHLERMANYVGKNSKQYTLTDQGFRFLQEIDHSYIDNRPEQVSVSPKVMEDQMPSRGSIGRQSLKEFMWIIPYAGIVAAIISVLQVNSALGLPGLDLDKMIANASLISSLSITGILAAAFLIMFRRQIIPRGTKGVFLSTVTVASVVAVNLIVFSGLYTQIGVISSVSYATELIANASLISSLSITGILAAAFLIMFRRQIIPRGTKGVLLSTVTVASVVAVNLIVFSGLYTQIGVISSVSYATELITNASLISSLSITGILAAAFLVIFRHQIIPGGVKGLTFPALIVISVVIVNILVFSGLGAQVTMNQVVY